VHVRYAEDLWADGSLDVTSNERAAATDVYVMKGGGVEVYEPRFYFPRVSLRRSDWLPWRAKLENLLGCVVHTDSESTVPSFATTTSLTGSIERRAGRNAAT